MEGQRQAEAEPHLQMEPEPEHLQTVGEQGGQHDGQRGWRPEELRLQHEALSLLVHSERHRAGRAHILQRHAAVERQLAAQSFTARTFRGVGP